MAADKSLAPLLRSAEQQAARFVADLQQGRIDDAYKRTSEAYREHHKRLRDFAAAMDLSKAKVTQTLGSESAACVVVSPITAEKDGRTLSLGMGMIRFGNSYLIRDLDLLPDDEAVEEFVAGFKEANPKSAEAEALKGKLVTWVEEFFSESCRDITARKTIEWGEPEIAPAGNLARRRRRRTRSATSHSTCRAAG